MLFAFIINIKEMSAMFKVKKAEDTTNRTFRMPISLIEKMSEIAQNANISLNSFVIQCCEYAIENMEGEEKED